MMVPLAALIFFFNTLFRTELLAIGDDQIISGSGNFFILGLQMEWFWPAAFWNENRHALFFFFASNYQKQIVYAIEINPYNTKNILKGLKILLHFISYFHYYDIYLSSQFCLPASVVWMVFIKN